VTLTFDTVALIEDLQHAAVDWVEEILTTVSTQFGHADYAAQFHLPPVQREGEAVVIHTIPSSAGSGQMIALVMQRPGRPLGNVLLGGATKKLIHFPHDPDPAKDPNVGRFETLLGRHLEEPDIYPFPAVIADAGPRQTVYAWKNSGPGRERWLSRRLLEENPAAWWTRPVFRTQWVEHPSGVNDDVFQQIHQLSVREGTA
jgi:hypothetical protein